MTIIGKSLHGRQLVHIAPLRAIKAQRPVHVRMWAADTIGRDVSCSQIWYNDSSDGSKPGQGLSLPMNGYPVEFYMWPDDELWVSTENKALLNFEITPIQAGALR